MLARALIPLLCTLPLAAQVIPKERIDLLADPTLSNFVFHLSEKNSLSTEQDEVARIEDGVLQVTGKGFGYFRTREAYKNYHLVAEYKWGERTWSKREDRARDCGLLLHCHGPDGSFGGAWISCVQAQMLEGSTGDINVLQGKTADGNLVPSTITCEVVQDENGGVRFKEGGEATTFPPEGKTVQSIRWKDRDPDWKDVKGFRRRNDVANPVGEWNRLEVICDGGSVRIILNGELVNEGRDAKPDAGWVGIQNEWAECWFRRLELWPFGKFDEKWEPPAASKNTGYSETGESILPRRFPLSPEESAAQWRIDGDYELQLVAAEPLTCDPVDVVWDAQGSMFVAEMRDYPLPPAGGAHLSRIRLLRDHDGDGRMDDAVTWADHLDHVQGLLPMQDGLLATTRTAILFLRDTDGDDRADEIRPLFHANEPRHNQLQVASPRWGLDNAIYLNNGLDGKEIYPHGDESAKVEFARHNLRFDPYRETMTPVSGRGQYGATLDDFGRRFSCSNRNPVMFAVMPLEAVRRNPAAHITQGYEDIQPAAAPVRPVTLSHTTAMAHAGTHTAACGLAVYRGDAMPKLKGDIFVCEPTAQLVTRNHLVPNGASFTAERVGEHRDFLVSADEWCRPVQIRNGPDGALYICDMYRRFIDHAMFFPDEFAETNYMRAGFDHGRIWRLVKKGDTPRSIEPLPEQPRELVNLLDCQNAWQRIHAQRLLVERGNSDVVPELIQLLHESSSALGRLHALWSVDGLGGLEAEHIRCALEDPKPEVVESAIALAAGGRFDDQLLRICESNPSRSAFLAAIALGRPDADPNALRTAHTDFLKRGGLADPWMRRAVLSATRPVTLGALEATLDHAARTGVVPGGSPADMFAFLREFSAEIAARGQPEELARVAGRIKPGHRALPDVALVEGLADGLSRGSPLAKSLGSLLLNPPATLAGDQLNGVRAVLDEAVSIALDKSEPDANRLAALRLVSQRGFATTREVAGRLLSASEPPSIQAAACRALSRFDRAKVAEFLFARWDSLGPEPLREAIAILTGSTATARKLMEKMKAGEINKALMPPMQRWSFCRSSDPELKALANELFGTPDADRARVIAHYQGALATLEGDAARGRAVFEQAACATCHRASVLGTNVGPDLADVRIKPPEALLTDILDPNRMIEERWVAYTIVTNDQRSLAGLITSENDKTVTLTIAGGTEQVVPRDGIASLQSTGLSLMPVGLESVLSEQQMADLLAFLRQP